MSQKITPMLWFDNQAEEAAKFYTSIFKNSKMLTESVYPETGQEVHGMEPGSPMVVEFELEGQRFTALNGGPVFKFTEAISFVVDCKDQAEVDYFWEKLLAGGGQESQCGWLKDKFGVSWQVTPSAMEELMSKADKAGKERIMGAMMKMVKFDIKKLEEAARG